MGGLIERNAELEALDDLLADARSGSGARVIKRMMDAAAAQLILKAAQAAYDAALRSAPELVMAYLGKAWPLVLANDPTMAVQAQALLEDARQLPMNDRERAHLAALSHAVIGHRASAVAVLD